MSILSSPATFSGNKLTQPSFDHFSPANRRDHAQISSPLNNGSDAAPGENLRSKVLWAQLLYSLHASRHQAAVREMSRYRFLVEDAQAPAARSHSTVPKPSAPTKEGGRTSGLRLALLLLACFAVIHAMAVVRMESASRASATPLESPVRLAPSD